MLNMISMNPSESLLGNLWPARIFSPYSYTHCKKSKWMVILSLKQSAEFEKLVTPVLGNSGFRLGPIWWKCMKSFNRKNNITPIYCNKSMHAQKLLMLRLLIKTKHHNLKNRDSIIPGTQVTDKAYGPLYFNLTSFLCALHENPMI